MFLISFNQCSYFFHFNIKHFFNFFFDSYAIIEILKNNTNYDKFKELTIFTSSINISEVYYSLIKNVEEEIAENFINSLNIQILIIDKDSAIKAAKFKFKFKKEKLSYIDCLGYEVAKKLKIKFLTGDEGFRDKENVEFVK